MDEEISRWILEFVVRQPIDDNLLEIMLSKLPLRPGDAILKNALLLRRIQSAVSNGSVSENVLDLLELVRNLEFSHGKVASESMKMAYCAVAVDCIVRFLDEEPEKSGDYYQAMKRIWKVRVRKIERSEDTGLISGKLLLWRDDLKAAIRDPGVCDRILSKNTRNEALKAVKGYLADAWKDLGPTFLEKTAAEYKVSAEGNEQGGISQRDGNDPRIVETGVVDDDATIAGRKSVSDGVADDDATIAGRKSVSDGNDGGEKPKGEQDLPVDKAGDQKGSEDHENAGLNYGLEAGDGGDGGDKHGSEDKVQEQEGVPDHQKGEQASEVAQCTTDLETQELVEIAVRHRHVNLRGILKAPKHAKIPDPVKTDEANIMSKTESIPPPEVSQAKEGSDSGSKEPQHVSTNPLSNAPHTGLAATNNPITKEAHVHDANHTQQTKNDVEDTGGKKRLSECSGPVRAELSPQRDEPSPKKRRVDGQSVHSEDNNNGKVAKEKIGAKPVKPSLMERNPSAHTFEWEELGGTSASASPNGPFGRRMKRRWTSTEEDTLREGVRKFGKGNWKIIQQAYRDIFQNRSEVDLKDKWRNLTRR